MSRRTFLAQTGGASVLAPAATTTLFGSQNHITLDRAVLKRQPLRVQPVFIHSEKSPKEATSWRWSAEIYEERSAAEERGRINRELKSLKESADFPTEFLPLISVTSEEQAETISDNYDAMILYAAARSPEVMEILARENKWNIAFLRHKSGPIYYMYIGIHGHFLRKRQDHFCQTRMDSSDVVIDSQDDLLWRLRSLCGLKNTLGKRIVNIGPSGGWGAGGQEAPERANETWGVDIQNVSYDELTRRIKSAREDQPLIDRCRKLAREYLDRGSVRLETSLEFLDKAFLLAEIFRDYLREAKTDALTIGSCMHAVMPVSETTACMPLSLLNDQGYLALCEADFQSIPAGVLLHYISGKPVFMGNGSFPYAGEVLLSHCTAPSKMDGQHEEPVRIVTHYESDFGAAPKVEMRSGQEVTVLDPDFAGKRILGFTGKITATPFYPMCRTQLEIAVKGDIVKLRDELQGWHWMLCYGDHLQEIEYAVRKAGLKWEQV
jgi:hypothetical protein